MDRRRLLCLTLSLSSFLAPSPFCSATNTEQYIIICWDMQAIKNKTAHWDFVTICSVVQKSSGWRKRKRKSEEGNAHKLAQHSVSFRAHIQKLNGQIGRNVHLRPASRRISPKSMFAKNIIFMPIVETSPV